MAHAGAGGIAVSGATQALVAERDAFSFSSPESIKLKGFPEAQTLYRLDWHV